MSSAKHLNDLNMSLHNTISGENKSANIPFADDEKTNLNNKEVCRSSDSISSNESFHDDVNFNPRRRVQLKMYRTGNDASDESESDDNMEKRDKPGPLASEMRRVEDSNLAGMRRNSISMPTLNENALDALRSLHMKACESQDNTSSSKESLDHIMVSEPNECLATCSCVIALVNHLTSAGNIDTVR